MERLKTTKTIASPKGKILLFGGVYSNLQALAALRQIADQENISADQVICTGDLVAYCAQPEECIESIRNWGIHCIAGNVEIQLREDQEDCGCNFTDGGTCDLLSRQWYPFVQSKISSRSIDWLKTLPDFIQFEQGDWKATVVHGSYQDTSEFLFKSSPKDRYLQSFEHAQSNLIIAGHCGLPFHKQIYHKLWLNPGVIGMPANDGTTRVWYMILDLTDDDLRFAHKSFEYDHQLAADLMLQNQLPATYAKTLKTGLWDNCEILPQRETDQMGVALNL